MTKLKTSAAALVAAARARITEISTPDAIAMVENPDVVIVDLRDVRERDRTGYIPDSFHCPRGMAEFWVDPESPYFKDIFGQDKTFVFHCASGWRSALTVATLNDMGFDCVHLRDGFGAWVSAGGPVVKPA
jgi:rhodanese-related sulfurtransferase